MFRNPYSTARLAAIYEDKKIGELNEDDLDDSYLTHGVASDYACYKIDSSRLFKNAQ